MCIVCTSLYVLFSFLVWPLCCSSSIYGFWLPLWYLHTLLCSFSDYIVCPSLIYGFWLPLWHLQTFLVTYITFLKIDNNTHNCMFIFLRLNIYSQTCPCGHVLQGHPFLVLSYKIWYLSLFIEVTCLIRPLLLCLKGDRWIQVWLYILPINNNHIPIFISLPLPKSTTLKALFAI